jgi:N-acetylmuramoyl-L-alanine amidase
MKDPAAWDQLRRYLGTKGYKVSMFDGSDAIEKHVENVNKINKLGASVFVAMDIGLSDQNRTVIAVTTAKKGKGNILAIDEIPALHVNESRELATSLAATFNKGVKEIPLFPLLGVDIPGVYVKIDYTPDKTNEVLQKFLEGMQRFFKRGKNDER